jgi:hypothetical protein
MLKRAAIGALLLAPPCVALAQGPVIEHAGVGCIVADKHPRIDARVAPAESVARARVYFRASGTPAWYFVTMKPVAGVLQGALPKPSKGTRTIDYYVEALDKSLREARTAEFTPSVVQQGEACPNGKLIATALAAAPVALGAGAGAPAVPAGFANAGIVGIGGGLSTGAIVAVVAGGGAAVAGGLVVASKAGGKDEGSTGGQGNVPTRIYNIVFGATPQNGIDVSACVGRPLSWCCQNINQVQPDGSFNIVWSPTDPNTVRVVGRVDSTRLDATLSCVSGAGPTGSITATGNGSSYSGSFSFASSQGSVTITRQP